MSFGYREYTCIYLERMCLRIKNRLSEFGLEQNWSYDAGNRLILIMHEPSHSHSRPFQNRISRKNTGILPITTDIAQLHLRSYLDIPFNAQRSTIPNPNPYCYENISSPLIQSPRTLRGLDDSRPRLQLAFPLDPSGSLDSLYLGHPT